MLASLTSFAETRYKTKSNMGSSTLPTVRSVVQVPVSTTVAPTVVAFVFGYTGTNTDVVCWLSPFPKSSTVKRDKEVE